jgi:hypothetical protein
MLTRDELLYRTAGETPRCIIVPPPTPSSAGTLLARVRRGANFDGWIATDLPDVRQRNGGKSFGDRARAQLA